MIGVDIGGTKIAFALVNEEGHALVTHQLPTLPANGLDAVLDRIGQGIGLLLEQASQAVCGVGIGCPGMVDPVGGMVYKAVNLNWEVVALRDEIQRRLSNKIPVYVQNDVKAAAVGERYFGAARQCDHFVYLAIGTGLGGAAVTAGQLVLGAAFFPMDLGHLVLDPDGRLCACGLHGCSETYVSGKGLLAGVREHRLEYPESELSRLEVTTTSILQAAYQGDKLALLVLDEAASALGQLMACSVAVLNPALFVIGGGLGHAAAQWLLPGAEVELRRRVLPVLYEKLRIVQSQVTASAVGAASLVWDALGSATEAY